jgi:hypothetical protein
MNAQTFMRGIFACAVHRALGIAVLAGLGLHLSAHAVSPLFTDDADTVPKGKFQLGTGVEYYKAGSLRRWSLPLNPVIGLNDRWEAGVNCGYQWQKGPDSLGAMKRADSLLDTTLATKWKWFDQTSMVACNSFLSRMSFSKLPC